MFNGSTFTAMVGWTGKLIFICSLTGKSEIPHCFSGI